MKQALKNESDWLLKYDEAAIRSFCDLNVSGVNTTKVKLKYVYTLDEIDRNNFELSIKKAVGSLLT